MTTGDLEQPRNSIRTSRSLVTVTCDSAIQHNKQFPKLLLLYSNYAYKYQQIFPVVYRLGQS